MKESRRKPFASTDVKTGWLVFSSRARPESNEPFLGAAEVVSLLGFCCDQPEKGCQELPQIDRGTFAGHGKRQALVRFFVPSEIAAQSHGHVAANIGHQPLVGLIRRARARQRHSKNPGVCTKGRRSTASTSHAWSRIERAQSRTLNLGRGIGRYGLCASYMYVARSAIVLAETAVLPAMKSVSRRRPACLPIVHIYCAVVVAIVVESTKGLEYYCSTPR